MRQTLKVEEERSREPDRELNLEPEQLAHLQHDSLAAHQQQRDKQEHQQYQQSVELKMSAESKEISSIKQEVEEVAAATAAAAPAIADMEGTTSNRCAGCREPIRDKFIFSVIDLNWHQDCVQCADCLLKLNERCHTFDGKLYCRQDYWRRFGPKCFACKESIERNELVQIIKGNRIYHLKCFTCSECNKPLKAGEQLHLIEGKRLLCKQDYHHQLNGCKSPASNYHSNNNNNNNNSSSSNNNSSSNNHSNSKAFQSTPQQQSQQHTISSATYFTLMSNQKQKEQNPTVQEQTISRRPTTQNNSTKLEGRHQNAGLSACETGDCDEMDGFEDELEADGDEDADADEVELEEEGASYERVLGFDQADNNLENEENRSVLRFGPQDAAAAAAALDHSGDSGLSGAPNANRLRKAAANRVDLMEGEVKRRRRRRKKLQTAAGGATDPSGLKRLTNRNGESILNGMPPASSILAVQSTTSQQQQQSAPHQQLLQQNNPKSVPSSAASTASNSSTSSSISLNHGSSHHQQQHHPQPHGHHPHPHHPLHHPSHQRHHQQQDHHQQQQQQSQRSSSGGGGGNQSGGGHKPTRVRTVLNEKQLQTLRDCYAHNPRPDALMKEQLVEMTGLSSRVIRVWFQNKRCKDKKKSIQHKQMLQYEKDGRHLAGLTLMRGVPMVASSPIQYDEHSTVSSTPGLSQQQQPQSGTTMLELQPTGNQVIQQQQQLGRIDPTEPTASDPSHGANRPSGGHFGPASVHSPASANHPQPVDIHAYQPPWKNLIEYANHGDTPPDRLNTASPRYQQLIGQIHGYNSNNRTEADQQAEQQQQQQLVSMAELQPQARNHFQQPPGSLSFSTPTTATAMDQQQHSIVNQPPMGHLRQQF